MVAVLVKAADKSVSMILTVLSGLSAILPDLPVRVRPALALDLVLWE